MFSEKDKRWEDIPSCLIYKICAKWEKVQSFLEQYHPNKSVASYSMNIFIDNDMPLLRKILKQEKRKRETPELRRC